MIDAEGKVVVSRTFYSDQLKVFASAKFTMMNFFFQYSHKSVQGTADLLKQGKPQSFLINMALNVQYTSKYQDIISYNVIGKITGSDPVLKNQYVVHSAHLDHLGIGAPVQGDSIYNAHMIMHPAWPVYWVLRAFIKILKLNPNALFLS